MTASKAAALAKQFEGSVVPANRNFSDRERIRKPIGSRTMQQLNLK
jgi:hypothetical protein